MNRHKLPRVLVYWLEDREFNYLESDKPGYFTEDEIYSAAHELKNDMEWDTYNDDYTPREKATITRFINREKTTHKYVSFHEWYNK